MSWSGCILLKEREWTDGWCRVGLDGKIVRSWAVPGYVDSLKEGRDGFDGRDGHGGHGGHDGHGGKT